MISSVSLFLINFKDRIFFDLLKNEPKCKINVSPNSAPVKSISGLLSYFAAYQIVKYFSGISFFLNFRDDPFLKGVNGLLERFLICVF